MILLHRKDGRLQGTENLDLEALRPITVRFGAPWPARAAELLAGIVTLEREHVLAPLKR